MSILKSLALVASCISVIVAQNKVIVGYFTEWDNTPVSSVDFSKVTHINYSFGKFDPTNLKPKVDNPQLLNQVVVAAHAKQAKVLVSLGGWTGSKTFSPIVKDPTSRSNFAKGISEFVQENKLDGIDIDWEYPGAKGDDNQFDVNNDSNNYLIFLKELRKLLGTKLITAAVSGNLFVGVNDASEFAKVFDFINIMAYDFNFSTAPESGPNAGLDFEAGKGAQISVKSSIKTWVSGGVPANKLVLGIPFYGTIGKVAEDLNESTGMYSKRVAGSGEPIAYSKIMSSALSSSKQASNGYVRYFDKKSQTPWLFNKATKTLISYDDTESLKIKAQYATSQGLLGVMIWDLNQDFNSELLNSIQFVRGGKPLPEQPTKTSNPSSIHSAKPTKSAKPSASKHPKSKKPKKSGEFKIQPFVSDDSKQRRIGLPTPIPEPLVNQETNSNQQINVRRI